MSYSPEKEIEARHIIHRALIRMEHDDPQGVRYIREHLLAMDAEIDRLAATLRQSADSGRVGDEAAANAWFAICDALDKVDPDWMMHGPVGVDAAVAKIAALAAQGQGEAVADAPSIEAATAMGAKGGPAVEAERLAFEAWMRGHCWPLCATWNGTGYRGDAEQGGKLCPNAMTTRGLWAAWRDRAALAAPAASPAGVPDGWVLVPQRFVDHVRAAAHPDTHHRAVPLLIEEAMDELEDAAAPSAPEGDGGAG